MSLATPIRVVSALDPAVFHDPDLRPEVGTYRETRDPALIPKITRPEGKPAVFLIRRLKRSEWHLTEAQSYLSLRKEFALRMGLVSIEGHPQLEAMWKPAGERLNDAELDLLFDALGADVLEEMGELILQESRSPKGSARSYRLPHSCLLALGRMPSDPPCAGENQESAEGRSSAAL